LTDQLANLILEGNLVSGDEIIVDANSSGLVFDTETGVAGKAV
jgi:hypothetical protein